MLVQVGDPCTMDSFCLRIVLYKFIFFVVEQTFFCLFQILEFCKQRIGCDYCGDQVTSYSPVDNTVSQEHLTYMKNKSSTVIGRDDIIKVVSIIFP